jgi:hypothetical protein
MLADPEQLIRGDPELFDFIYDLFLGDLLESRLVNWQLVEQAKVLIPTVEDIE